ncbi:hypothetical protein [Adonisia turfae]|uniref:hypothetical protein n=1 Tax=Adonisia turfae TaxID=2950184 RepID=UPI0013D28BEE|nr:hypothetical protein [Adonisia turfae]
MTMVSDDTLQILETLKKVAAKTLEKKKRLGQYAVVWRDGKATAVGEDAPQSLANEKG